MAKQSPGKKTIGPSQTPSSNPETFWTRQPSGFLQRLGIWTSILLTAATTYLAVITFNTAVDIKGMDLLLRSTNEIAQQNAKLLESFKPSLKVVNLGIDQRDTVLFLITHIKNFGGRPALEIHSQSWLLNRAKNERNWNDADTIPEISPGQQVPWLRKFELENISAKDMLNSDVVIKLRYLDIVGNRKDSLYFFGHIFTDPSGSMRVDQYLDPENIAYLRIVFSTGPPTGFY